MRKSLRSGPCYRVTVGTGTLKQQVLGRGLFLYTLLTFVVVLAIYLTTKDWKGFTAPEEVDLGAVRVPSRSYRRKHAPRRHSDC